MKNRFRSRFRKDLFPEMPETFPAGLLRAAQSAGANPRRVVHVRTVFAWAAAAALIVVCVALFGLGIFARQNRSRREAASAFDYSVVGKWTMTAVEMNGTSVDPDMFGADLGVWLEFTDDGGPTHGHDSGKMMLTGVMDGSDSLRQDGTYRVNGTIITAVDEKGEAMEIRYDPETDTLTLEHDYDDGGSFHVVLIFSRTPDAEIPPSLVGKWTRIRQEIADDDGKVWTDPAALPDADESWTEWQSWLVFGRDGWVTLTDCYDPKTGNALHNSSEYRLASERDVEIDFGDGYSMQYDRESDTILLYINDRTRYTYARTPDAEIFSRVLNKQTLLGVWKLTRSEHAVDPSPIDGFDYDYLKWEKEQTWEEDAKPQPWYLEFTADGRMYYFLYAPDGGVQGNQSAPYTISGNTLQWSGWTMRYEAETDTICWIHPTDRREYYERAPDAVIDDPYRQKISDLRKQYPEYFDLYATPRLKVIVWQMAEGSYSCALVPGSDLRKEAEIGIESRGTTIEEMRMILSTYYEARDCDIKPEQIEVVPFQNPISSYAYEIDETYTGRVRWLLTGIPFECDDPLYSAPLDSKVDIGGILNLEVSTVCDVDGDGRLETCMLTYGPTSGLFTFTLSVYRNGTAVYRNTFQTAYGYFRFQRMTDGLNLYYYDADSIKTTGRSTAAYAVTIENGAIVLTDEETGEAVPYWGAEDPEWNMKGGA